MTACRLLIHAHNHEPRQADSLTTRIISQNLRFQMLLFNFNMYVYRLPMDVILDEGER